jgi:Predicted translation initiation factor 2B subunit, eIF-2B alpha/beta/delta family
LKFGHIAFDEPGRALRVLDQRFLPTRIRWYDVRGAESARYAIKNMVVRGAPLIGVVGAFGLALELDGRDVPQEEARKAADEISSARPTAINLPYA